MRRLTVIAVIVTISGLVALLALRRSSDNVVPASRVPEPQAAAPLARVSHDWDRADRETVRLPPARFSALPPAVASRLQDLGCTIPQAWGEPGLHNVITGRFMSSLDSDWAVLCSRRQISSILVFPEGSTDSMVELEAGPDRHWLQGIGGGRVGFSRVIEVASRDQVMAYFKAFGGPEPPPLEHDGINDIFVDKASTIRYWHAGQWLELQGAD